MSQDRLPEPTCNPRHTLDPFHRLVEDLSLALGPSSGIDSADVAPDVLERLMESYMSDPKDWGKYAFGDLSRTYTRNLVDTGNGKSNLVRFNKSLVARRRDVGADIMQLILVWTPGRGSPIHDHADAHCVMKVLKGSLKETLYTWPNRNQVNDGLASPLKIQKETVYGRDQVTYMSDNVRKHIHGIHPDTHINTYSSARPS